MNKCMILYQFTGEEIVNQSIFLIGFMGAGKTTVGQYLQKTLNYPWIDLDHYIEEKLNMTIPEIFKLKGEDFFRQKETECLRELSGINHGIFSTGGGIIKREENREMLKKHFTVYLKWPFDLLYDHIKGDPNRPLVKNYSQLRSLFSERESLYHESASVIITCQDKTIEQVGDEIIQHFIKVIQERGE